MQSILKHMYICMFRNIKFISISVKANTCMKTVTCLFKGNYSLCCTFLTETDIYIFLSDIYMIIYGNLIKSKILSIIRIFM